MAVKKQSKQQEQKNNYWSGNLKGRMRVYAQEVNYEKKGKPMSFLKFSTSLGVKNEDGVWDNFYINVRFMKGDTPCVNNGENFEIEIENAFLTFETYSNKDGEEIRTPTIVVQDWSDIDGDF